MATRNDVTGDDIVSKSNSDAYRNGWENIFGDKDDSNIENIDEVEIFDPAEEKFEITSEEVEYLNSDYVQSDGLCSCAGSNGALCICS